MAAWSQVDAEHAEMAFGQYAPSRCWNRGSGGGYHDPAVAPRDGQSMDFKAWMAKWTSPESALPPRRHVGDPDSPLQMASALNLSQTTSHPPSGAVSCSGSSRADGGARSGTMGTTMGSQQAWQLATKSLTYPNPTNWKRDTSMLTRKPGFVGTLRTR